MVDFATLATPLVNFGGFGLLVAYLVWDRLRTDRIAEAHRASDLALQEKKMEAEKALAVSLALLTEIIKGGR